MSSDLPPAPTTRAPDTGEPIVEFVRTQRANAAYVLLGLAAALLAVTVWLASKGERAGAAAPPPTPDAANPDAPPAPVAELDTPRKGDYRFGWIATGVASLIVAGAGARLLAALPKPTEAAQRTSARRLVLGVGAGLGAVLVLAGAVYFYRWSDSLTKWLDQGERAEMRWVVIPLLMVVAGAGLVFAAVQPARREERNNQGLRRLVYGANLGLTVLLLAVALVILNVVAAQKVQNTLDTTDSGFYTLSNATRSTVAKLSVPVTAYVIFPDDGTRKTNDLRQLMFDAQEASGGKFTPRFVSPVSNKLELKELEEEFKKLASATDFGILLTTGPKGTSRNEFIPRSDLFKADLRPGAEQPQEAFVGEAALVQKLRFLDDGDKKAVVYFTQGNGELSLGGEGGEAAAKADRSASQLKAHLESMNLEVRPLAFKAALKAGGATEVPADAAAVVVADPEGALSDEGVKALRDYATGPRKGRLLVMAEPRAGAGDRKMVKTGVEGLASDLGVKLGEQFVYSQPWPGGISPRDALVKFGATPTGEHPIVQPFPNLDFVWGLTRELTAAGGPGGAFQVSPLMVTDPRRITWLESEELADPFQKFRDLIQSETLAQATGAARKARWVAVASAEGSAPPNPMNPHAAGAGPQTPRLVVFATAGMFSNTAPAVRGGGTPPSYELVSASIDWLRERPPIALDVETKPYKVYNFPTGGAVNESRLIWLPLGLALFAVAGLGAGVWVIRRK